jgi:uncharacterized OB-fold protein
MTEEKKDNNQVDISGIANAVARELARLDKDDDKTGSENLEVFKCPDCGASVAGGARICGVCGCELEWGE